MDNKPNLTVREHARITTAVVEQTLDQACVSQSAFDWLCDYSARLSAGGASLVQIDGRKWLRLDNYVGVVETPCGTRIEILPKHSDQDDDIRSMRRLLIRMLTSALNLKSREAGQTSLQTFNMPLPEWLMSNFLREVDRLVKRGLRFDYNRVEEESRFLRGQLNAALQNRQPPDRQHLFQIRHDIFSADRAENRLVRTAVDRVRKATHDPDNWRLANELSIYLEPVPISKEIEQDFKAWRKDRLMQHYASIHPLCELVLRTMIPLTQVGAWAGFSMLFPMERLFERYLSQALSKQLTPGAKLASQSASAYLCEHNGQDWFKLIPDMIVTGRHGTAILDAKWKLLDQAKVNAKDKYGLSQQDLYQLLAYGQQILGGQGELFLIYPKTSNFHEPLEAFEFDDKLRLWVVPFDLEEEHLLEGRWLQYSPWHKAGLVQAA